MPHALAVQLHSGDVRHLDAAVDDTGRSFTRLRLSPQFDTVVVLIEDGGEKPAAAPQAPELANPGTRGAELCAPAACALS